MELKFRIQEFKKLNAMPTFNPQVKKGFFGKWKNILMFKGTPISKLDFGVYDHSIRCLDTWDEAMEILNKYKDFVYEKNAEEVVKIINRKVC
jgi:hypothetical protein